MTTTRRLVAGLFFIAVLSVLATFATAQARKESAEARLQRFADKEGIEAVLLEYGRSLDARDFAAYSALFASDGEWVGGFGSVKGPANIKAFMEKNMGTGKNTTNNYHLLSNFVIKVTGDTATAWSRWAFVQPQSTGGATIGSIVPMLARSLGRPVVDQTGLTQLFDIELQFSEELPSPDADAGPPLKAALSNQLGFRVDEGRTRVEVLIIDRVEHPTPN